MSTADGRGEMVIDTRDGLTCNQLLLQMMDPTNASRNGNEACLALQTQYRETCCNPDYESTPAPQAPPPVLSHNFPFGKEPQCDICLDGSYPKRPHTITAVLYLPGNPTCHDLYWMGRTGNIPSRLCYPLQDYMQEPCLCANNVLEPSTRPTQTPSLRPVSTPTAPPTIRPTTVPTLYPSHQPSIGMEASHSTSPTQSPSLRPISTPSIEPTSLPTADPTMYPSQQPTSRPVHEPTLNPSNQPSTGPSRSPSYPPSSNPSSSPSAYPSQRPSSRPVHEPTFSPSDQPSIGPSRSPSYPPSSNPSSSPSAVPSQRPSSHPVQEPIFSPSNQPSIGPSANPTRRPSSAPTFDPTGLPSDFPTTLDSTIAPPMTEPETFQLSDVWRRKKRSVSNHNQESFKVDSGGRQRGGA